ncbi:hypothetical protein FH972_014759 [Carpinus fangiana]|uniref:Uncharacterized protein n=1 Tax=Carpinus fangiana TaxID=176857 RepID=A0A5N6RDE0_9ROSI|nr:hypothetical protein FH972_014759 [Carpinus fangiana]
MVRMIPIWVATFVPSIMIAQINTLFVRQGATLDRGIGSFKIPPASLVAFVTIFMLVSVMLYDRFFVKIMRRHAPENMKSLGTSYSLTTQGVGNFLSSFLLSMVSHITKKHGHCGWILNNLNASHLDYYYAFFVILNFLNFIFFLIVIKFYVYKAEVSDSIKVLTEELKGMTVKVSDQEESRR